MAISKDKAQELWVDWTHDAMSGYVRPEEGIDDADEAADDMVDVATKYADSMLDEYEKRFGTTAGKKKRRKRGEPDDDDDEEDPD